MSMCIYALNPICLLFRTRLSIEINLFPLVIKLVHFIEIIFGAERALSVEQIEHKQLVE